ncbi:MAG: camphor resistance protein CrcB [Candidatus Methanofastidiosum methylothiophilum]|uniref:Fluoride-specific ion channel FluC n=1 Tax=Candidatus Methanofastidiosum methylothiophilum TaxID=1705564 RepID=A0A150IIW4_9EURY|nr:MAG: camphor resistance protein CrcB [Candidatus Methanofastidiosum methylthiophilus]KYC47816.1 MAG: camphor resistance protein CrcB [Candidatus Methanofastidiosum methylthiophilus]KYC49816.1 MAG: camphor resistance protein CrcB [Candidatus Methanofastidiosum methylthiophilus]
MNLLILIGIGGFIGAVLRYLVSGWIQNGATTFPIGTMGVNVIGSFVLGTILFASEYKGILSEETRIFLTIGLLGAFTTMSTFSYESFRLLESKDFLRVSFNIMGTIFLTISAIYLSKVLVIMIGGGK